MHHDHQIGQRHRFVLAVGDMDKGDAELALQPLQLLEHEAAQERVERRERLVEQQNLRLGDKRSRERNPLLLTSRELRGQTLGKILHFHQPQKLARPGMPRSLADPSHLQAERDIVEAVRMRKQRIALKHHCHAPPSGRQIGHVAVANQDVAVSDVFMPGNHAQRGGLAAPAWAEQAAVAGWRNAQREAVDRKRLAIAFGCRN